MSDRFRVTVEHDGETETALFSDGECALSAGDATARFDLGESASDDDGPVVGDDPRRIVDLDAVPSDSTIRFEARGPSHGVDCILRRIDDAVVAWRNSCPHRPAVPLDPGTGAIVRGDDLVCHKHGAQFSGGEGTCTHGPCAGDALDAVAVAVDDDAVYLTDDRFESARVLGQ
ncbi:Rieske (2Fe-2S) protein [Halomicrobium sp. HM KBTZ05]|uniref:Rieske (2Fe-2S) protein n=1 Tax=Halomicrobium sp. HM KBTZ05 TaxID=3242663 RepID=UPI0035561B21